MLLLLEAAGNEAKELQNFLLLSYSDGTAWLDEEISLCLPHPFRRMQIFCWFQEGRLHRAAREWSNPEQEQAFDLWQRYTSEVSALQLPRRT